MADYTTGTVQEKGFMEIVAAAAPDGVLMMLTPKGRAYVVKRLPQEE
jgi:hypothetical protein